MARSKSGGERASKVTSMQRHLEAWRNSGLSQRAYLDTTGVSKTLFSYWQHKVRPAACSTPVSSGFVPVAPPTIPSGAVCPERVFARIRCSDGRELLWFKITDCNLWAASRQGFDYYGVGRGKWLFLIVLKRGSLHRHFRSQGVKWIGIYSNNSRLSITIQKFSHTIWERK
jgi:hypothetical protein